MYARSYTIASLDELKCINRLANFYCALPVLSATFTTALLGGRIFKTSEPTLHRNNFWYEAPEILFLAKKLRNATLFRECFVHTVGQYELGDGYEQFLGDPHLLKMVQMEHTRICNTIISTLMLVLKISIEGQCVICGARNQLCWTPGPRNRKFFLMLKSEIDALPSAALVMPNEIL